MKNLSCYSILAVLLICACQKPKPKNSKDQPLPTGSIETVLPVKEDLAMPLTGTIADTAIAGSYLEQAKILIDSMDHDSALDLTSKAKKIYTKWLGEENLRVAEAWYYLGNSYAGIPKLDSAATCYQESINLMLLSLPENHIKISDAYQGMGNVLMRKNKFPEALSMYNKVLYIRKKILKPDHTRIADIYNNIGNAQRMLGEYKISIEYYQAAADKYIKNHGENHHRLADFYGNIGLSYSRLSMYKIAEEYFQKDLDIRTSTPQPNKKGLANLFNNMAINYNNQGYYDKGLKYYQKSIDLKLKIFGEKHSEIASSYMNIGVTYALMGLYDKALAHFQEALDIQFETLSPRDVDIGSTYFNIGLVRYLNGQLDEALSYYNKSLSIYLETYHNDHPLIADIYNNLGVIYQLKNQFDKALEYHEKGLAIRLDKFGYLNRLTADSYGNIGVIYKLKREFDKAKENYDRDLEIRLKTLDKNHPSIAIVYNNIGKLYLDLKDYKESAYFLDKALEIRLKNWGENHPLVSTIYYNFSDINKEKGEYHQAIIYNDRALTSLKFYPSEMMDSVISFTDLLTVLNQRIYINNQIYLKSDSLYYLYQSEKFCKTALSVQKELQNSYTEPNSKKELINSNYLFFENAIATYRYLFNATNNNGYLKGAFQILEKSKAFLAREVFNESKAKYYLNIPDSLLELELTLKFQITQMERNRFEAIEGEDKDTQDSLFTAYTGKIFDLKQSYNKLQQNIKEKYPEYDKVAHDNAVIDLNTVQKTLLDKNQTLIEYFIGDSTIFIFATRHDTCNITQIKKDFPLETWGKQLNLSISKQDNLIDLSPPELDSITQQYANAAYQIYQKILQPIAHFLDKGSELIIVPDGLLSYVPFDALLTEFPKNLHNYQSYHYLLKDHQISMALSATMLDEMKQKTHKQPPSKSFLGFAPSFPTDGLDTIILVSRSIDYSDKRNHLSPLKHNKEEIAAIQSLIGGDIYSDSAATEQLFTDLSPDYRILHLSTHGKANDKVGDYSFLAFYELKDSLENEWLYNREVYNLKLNADMVVLSACETGIGELQRGEGIISLARGFSLAGAKSIITTLWNINDEETPKLMQMFYRNLKEGMTKDAALRQAKIDYIQTGKHPEPYFWAAFVPIGDMQPIPLGSGKWLWYLVGVLFVGVVLFYLKKHHFSK